MRECNETVCIRVNNSETRDEAISLKIQEASDVIRHMRFAIWMGFPVKLI